MNNGFSISKKGWMGVILAVLFLAAIMPIAFSATSTAQTGDYYYAAQVNAVRFLPTTITAGDTVSMAVDIINSGSVVSITDFNATLATSDYFEQVTANATTTAISPGETKTVVLKFKVKNETPPGIYQAFLSLNYKRTDVSGSSLDVNQTQTIQVSVSSGQRNIVLDVNPKTISPGNVTTMQFSLTNMSSNPISNVLLTWSESTGLILPLGSDNRKFISSIGPGETVDVNYPVAADPNITTGIYPLTVSLAYNDPSGTQTQSSTVGIVAGGGTDFDISSETTTTGVSFSIANVGSNDAAAVIVKVPKQAGITVTGSDTVVIGKLSKGDYSIASFTIQQAADRNATGFAAGQGGSFRGGNNSNGAASATGTATNPDRNLSSGALPAAQAPVVDIYYTDTTGARQMVERTFQLSSSSAGGIRGALTQTAGATNAGTDNILLAAVIIILIAVVVIYNKLVAKKNWKKLLIAIAIAVVVPLAVLFLAPRAYSTVILAALPLIGIAALLIIKNRFHKKSALSKGSK